MPLGFEEPGFTDTRFGEYGIAHVTDIPDGLELLVVSKLSAALAEEIATHRAVVELNYQLPLAPAAAPQVEPDKPEGLLVLSEPARCLAQWIKAYPQVKGRFASQNKVALLDSGIDTSTLPHRPVIAYDYSRDRAKWLPGNDDLRGDHDLLKHGTRVARILDAALPDNVALASGRLCRDEDHVTVLRLVRAYGHLVSKENPDVVNLSVAPRDNQIACPGGGRVKIAAFHTNSLPFLFALALPRTITVMAAGNAAQPCNVRFVLDGTEPPIFAVATDATGARVSYSNYIDRDGIPWMEAFGGDDEARDGGSGILRDERNCRGTSFAAPFVTAFAFKLHVPDPAARSPRHRFEAHRRDLAALSSAAACRRDGA
jgi:hypothetical protein